MPKPLKTNAMRQLDAARIAYEPKTYEVDENDLSGVHIAEQIGLPYEPIRIPLVILRIGEDILMSEFPRDCIAEPI